MMQRTCSSCLCRARARVLGLGGTRSYSVVPKSSHKPKAQPAAETIRSSEGKFGLTNSNSRQGVSIAGSSKERVSPRVSDVSRGESSGASGKSVGARRSRLDGYLDDGNGSSSVTPQEYSPRTSTSQLSADRSEASDSRRSNRDGSKSTYVKSTSSPTRRPLYPPSSTIPTSIKTNTNTNTNQPSPHTTQTQAETPSRRKYHFKALHHETAIQAFHRPSTPSNPIIKYRDPFLFLRAAPSHILHIPPIPPFPPGLDYHSKHGKEVVSFGVIASKNAVSPFAPERGRVRKRFKAAVETVVNLQGLGDIRSDWSYLAVLNREVYEANMKDLCSSLENGLKFIKKQQERGIGSGLGQNNGKGDGNDRSNRDRPISERNRWKVSKPFNV